MLLGPSRRGASSFKADGGQPFQALIKRVNLNTHRFEGRYPEQRFGICRSEDNCTADEFAHEFDLPDPDVEFEFGPIRQLIRPLALGLEADGFEMLPRDEAICRAGIDPKKPFPSAVRSGRIADGYSDVCCSHVRSFFITDVMP